MGAVSLLNVPFGQLVGVALVLPRAAEAVAPLMPHGPDAWSLRRVPWKNLGSFMTPGGKCLPGHGRAVCGPFALATALRAVPLWLWLPLQLLRS